MTPALEPLRRIAAYAVCTDAEGRVLLVRASTSSGTPGVWSLPGGAVDHGEDPNHTVVRETAARPGVSPEDVIEHFWLHSEADVEHGGRAFEVLERFCTTEAQRQEAIHWARESAKMRWFYFDGIYLHYELGYKLR